MSFKTLTTFVVATVGLCLAGCGGTANVNTNVARNTANSAMNTVANAANALANTVANTAAKVTTDSPEDFLQGAAEDGMAEVEIGRLAAQKAASAEVKKFGQMMAADHAKVNAEVKALAAKKNVTLPDMSSIKSMVDDMREMSRADFEREYVDAMVEDHEADVAAFQAQADNSADADIKAFAAKTLPTLKMHLEKIKEIQSKMAGKAPANSNMNSTNRK